MERYDYTIKHLPGKLNPADAPSRRSDYYDDDDSTLAQDRSFLKLAATTHLNAIRADFELLLADAYDSDPFAVELRQEDPLPEPWKEEQGIIYHDEQVYVPEALRIQVMEENHDAPLVGHYGQDRTLELVKRTYFWPGMQSSIRDYVRACQHCQRNKPDTHTSYGLLAPLPVPDKPWSRIGMDMITDLPLTRSKNDCIMVYTDALTKMVHFVPCSKKLSAKSAADLLRKHVIKYHGIPRTIVSDRDRRWINDFWKALGNRLGFRNTPSSAHHPQTDGQTERVNTVVEAYLRSFVNFEQDDWEDWLDSAEFAYNNAKHSSTGVSPFFANSGRHPDHEIIPEGPLGEAVDEPAAAIHAEEMRELAETLKANLQKANARIVKYYNAHHQLKTFQDGDQVWLRTTNIRTRRPCKKLDRKKVGPFKVVRRIGEQAYQLDIPATLPIHPVFHVGLLETFNGPLEGQDNPSVEPVQIQGHTEWEVTQIGNSRRTRQGKFQYQVHWADGTTSWEPPYHLNHCSEHLDAFHLLHPDKPKPRPRDLREH